MSQGATTPSQPLRHPVRNLLIEVIQDSGSGTERRCTGDALSVGTARDNDIVLVDPKVSRYHFSVRAHGADVVISDLGSTNGTKVGALTLRDAAASLEIGAVISIGDSSLRVADGGFAMLDLHQATSLGGIVGVSPVMRELMARLQRTSASSAPVLVLGESGTGKELIARAIHEESPRASGPFVTMDAAAMTGPLFASEFFGHERGAFTGAHRRHIGAFERAHSGTLFLDEVGELDETMQSMLLGVIERGRFQRVGGDKEISVDVRLVCATHRDLRARVNDGRFRLDLYYRLAVVVLEVPALRQRPEDIEPLAMHFVRELGLGGSVPQLLTEPHLQALRNHSWPGNVRELRNAIMRAAATGENPVFAEDDVQVGVHAPPPGAGAWSRPYKEARRGVLDQFENGYLQRLLDRNDGSLRKAAREAGIDRSYLLQLLRKHGLRK